ncbi:MAG TPA: hypothetical protein DET40_09520 [Lentisphaeria bacterium]|nr:MAG: hypothetical protein A2X45_08310 [Lentisphaerae bacterium GWF2_50_93]HCE43775.1 hypothetical protein [Lentisphaeria bacterium]
MQKNGFVGAELIKMRSRLSEATSHGEKEAVQDKSAQPKQPHVQPPPETIMDKEWKKATEKRWDEFRILKRDFTGRLTESLSALPEEIRLAKDHAEQLQRALEKFAHLLDEIESLDDSKWNKDSLSSELPSAIRRVEHIRLEYLRITSKLKAIQRESSAAEGSDSGRSFIPEICSVSWTQGFKIGLIFFMPIIIVLALSTLVLAIAMFFALRT